jgi:hypothetical protein
MGKHRGKSAEGYGKDEIWNEKASPQEKARNFDAYDAHLKANAKDDDTNPYSKENFKG